MRICSLANLLLYSQLSVSSQRVSAVFGAWGKVMSYWNKVWRVYLCDPLEVGVGGEVKSHQVFCCGAGMRQGN